MTEILKNGYKEVKEHRIKRLVWLCVNRILFPVVTCRVRRMLLRMFGAKIAKTNTPIYGSVRIFAPWNLEVGPWCCIGPRVEIYNKGKVILGDHTIVSQECFLCTASHDVSSPDMKLVVKPISLGDGAWLAAKAIILPGVVVGEGAVIGCAAVVTKDVEPWTVVGGNPAKLLKKRILKGQ